jgi:hypothetical protein
VASVSVARLEDTPLFPGHGLRTVIMMMMAAVITSLGYGPVSPEPGGQLMLLIASYRV